MPLLLHKAIENGVIGLWKISEEVDELYRLSRLSDPDKLTYAGISSLHRKKEWLATRALLNNLKVNLLGSAIRRMGGHIPNQENLRSVFRTHQDSSLYYCIKNPFQELI
jgi:hypothetical protein